MWLIENLVLSERNNPSHMDVAGKSKDVAYSKRGVHPMPVPSTTSGAKI
jgi:hypothetical protein